MPPPSARLIYVDVLRALAIVSVMVCHVPTALAGQLGPMQLNGGRGVDLFFVLSGFLIGSTALARAAQPARLWDKFRSFWLLRTARIWPLYFGLLALYVLLPSVFAPSIKAWLLQHPWPYVTFTSNYVYQDSLELGVLWSLAIEEQFYLAVGLLIAATSMRRDTLAAAFTAVALVAVAVSIRYRVELLELLRSGKIDENFHTGRVFHSTLSRMEQLALGLSAAVVAPWISRHIRSRSQFIPWLGIAGAAVAIMYLPFQSVIGHTSLAAVFVACLVLVQLPALPLPPGRLASTILAAVGHIGKVSFGLYLFHPFVRRWLEPAFASVQWSSKRLEASLLLAATFAAATALASLSYSFFESPILRRARARTQIWMSSLSTRVLPTPAVPDASTSRAA